MKKKLSHLFFKMLETLFFIRVKFFQLKNANKKKVLVYTDSRGHEITKLYNKHNPFSSYAKYLIKTYCAEVYICPEKHTTLFDFLYFIEQNQKQYDYVVLHVGVVDFAPRPISQLASILKLKAEKISTIFGASTLHNLEQFEGYDVLYNDEKTSSIVPSFLLDKIAPKLSEIQNLIWINCNPVLSDWDGNYNKKRPANTNMVQQKSLDLQAQIKDVKTIDLTGWERDEIIKYTCDNVHLTQAGMIYIENNIKAFIP